MSTEISVLIFNLKLDFSLHNIFGFLIAFIPALINVALLLFVFVRLPKNKLINTFSLLVLCLVLWQINDTISRLVTSAVAADFYDSILSISWIFVAPICLLFTLHYVGYKQITDSRLLHVVLFVPSFIFLSLYQTHFYNHEYNFSDFWGWTNYHNQATLDIILVYWISVQVLIANILLFINAYRLRKKEKFIRLQSRLIAYGIAVPVVAGLISQMVLPIVLNIPSIPITSTFMSFFSVVAVICFSRYHLFEVSDLIDTDKILENMPLVIMHVSPQNKVTYINNYGIENLELNVDEIKNTSIQVFADNSLFKANTEFLDVLNSSLVGKSSLNHEIILKNKHGKEISLMSSFIPIINNNNIQGTLFVARDISELRKSFKLLKLRENMLEEAQAIAHLGSWEWDIKADKVIWSDELYRLYGFEPKSIEITYDKFLSYVHKDDAEKVNKIINASLVSHQSFHFYHKIIRSDGEIKILLSNGKVHLDEDKIPKKMFGTSLDVTNLIKTEELLKEQNIELKKANNELDRFVYSVSHDLRAPLTSLLGLINITVDDTPEAEQELHERLGMMKHSVKKLDNFIGDILDYSSNARLDVNKNEILFNDLITEIISQLKFINTGTQLKIDAKVEQTAKFVSDKHRINIVLNNLISNAIKYKDNNKENSFVLINVMVEPSKATILIEDNGIGISDSHHKKIFEMFYRHSKQSSGSGIGLYIVKETIDKLHGEISVESVDGVGSKFKVTLPNLGSNN